MTYNTKCDIYSFGVVLWEIGTRKFPFGRHTMNQLQIGSAVAKGKRPDTMPSQTGPHPVAPTFGELYVELMEACWNHDPGQRPSAEEVRAKLRECDRAVSA